MDWKSVADKIDEVEQFELGVKEGVYEGAKSMVEGFVALPKLFDKAKLDASEVLVRTATEQDYRERIFERAAQLARDTKDFGVNMHRDPVAMTTAGYNAVMGKVAQGKQAYAKAVTAAEQEGRLPQFYGNIGGRGGFEVMAAVFPIAKVGLAGKAGTLIKAGEELANASKVVEEAGAAAKVLTQVEAAAEAGAQYSKEAFGIIAKCPADLVFTSAQEAYKGSTVVGHALSKHAGRNPGIWGEITGSMKTWNAQGISVLNDIMRGPGIFETVTKNGVSFLEKRLSDGRGIRLNMDGTFKGFID